MGKAGYRIQSAKGPNLNKSRINLSERSRGAIQPLFKKNSSGINNFNFQTKIDSIQDQQEYPQYQGLYEMNVTKSAGTTLSHNAPTRNS